MSSNNSLAYLLKEERRFAPPAELAAQANVTEAAYEQAKADRPSFWVEQARRLTWATEPAQTLDWTNPPFARRFAHPPSRRSPDDRQLRSRGPP